MYPRSVSTTRRVRVRLHTLKDGCLHTFWLTKTCLCVTLNIWHLVCHIISYRCSRNKVSHHDFFYLRTLLIMQLLYLQDVSMCKLSHRRTCLYATCDIISYVLSRLPCFHANVSTTRCVRVRVRALKDRCLHTFWLTKSCLWVTINIWHLVCHIISHRCSRNKVPHHDFFYLRTLLIMQLFLLTRRLRV